MRKLALMIILCACTAQASEPNPASKLYNILVWGWSQLWPLNPAHAQIKAAEQSLAQTAADHAATSNNIAYVNAFVASNKVWTIDSDWPLADRLPAHPRQNVMGEAPWRLRHFRNGEWWHEYFVRFNAHVSTNPAVLSVSYCARGDDGHRMVWYAPVVSNSYPQTVTIAKGTNLYECYSVWCRIPLALTNSVTTWDNEVVFGSAEGSGRGFILSGVFVVDRGGQVYVGRTYTNIVNNVTNVVLNGMRVEE